MKKNYIFKSLAIMGIILCSLPPVEALELNNKASLEREVQGYCNTETYGKINKTDFVLINGTYNPLYCTYSDRDFALEKLKENVPTILKTISEELDLEEINNGNWNKYYDGMYSLADKLPKIFTEANSEFLTLRSFFDTYKNYDLNQEIMSHIENDTKNFKASSKKDKVELGILFPYYAPIAKEADNIITAERLQNQLTQFSSTGTVAPMSVTAGSAFTYAYGHATSPNTPAYAYFSGGDCANFASQILEAAGISQVVYTSEYSGWWHTRKPGFLGIGWTHNHSRSWTVADTFARYMGVGYTTKNHYNFSANIKRGDFIAADWDSNGSWDHIAFVGERDNYVGTYGGKQYYDYVVAQHTTNYYAWTSSSTNGWENNNNQNWTYARVRR